MADKEGKETTANDTSGTEVEEPTTEQKLETAQVELKTQTERADKAESSNQGLRGSLKEKDILIQESAGLKSDVSYLKDAIKVLATQGKVPEDDLEVTPDKRTSVDATWAQLEAKHDKERAEDAAKAEQTKYVQQAQGILQDAEDAGIAKDSEGYEDIYDLLVEGKVRNAERLIKKAKGTKPEDKESEKEKWITEGKRLAMETEGQLSSDTGGPQGSSMRSFTRQAIADMSIEDFVKNKEAIDAAQLAGRIK